MDNFLHGDKDWNNMNMVHVVCKCKENGYGKPCNTRGIY